MEIKIRKTPYIDYLGVPTKPLTSRQYEYFTTFVRLFRQNNTSPTMSRMAKYMKVSIVTVLKNYRMIVNKGYIIYNKDSHYYYPSKGGIYKILNNIQHYEKNTVHDNNVSKVS